MIPIVFSLLGSLTAITFPAPNVVAPINPAWSRKFLQGVTIPEGTSTSTAEDFKTCKALRDWAFTFDDGSTVHTLNVLTALKEKGIKATFSLLDPIISMTPQTKRF
jgi:peptidoglycan/xylan/chitin deacetylase (PgdA/CDA1 family)